MADSPRMNAEGVIKLTLFSNGAQLDVTGSIISVEVTKSVNRIPSARIEVQDGDMPNKDFPLSNSDNFKPGSEIKINAGYGDSEETIFKGIIVKHGLGITGNNDARLIVECRDKAVGMSIGRKNANYVDSKDSDIISKLIGNSSGLSADVKSTGTQYKELVQYYCSDWDFMLSRAEVNGHLVIVDDAKVTVAPPQTDTEAVLKVTYGDDLMEFHAEVDALSQLTSVKGVSWDLKTQDVVSDEAAPQTLNAQGDLHSADLAGVAGPPSYILQSAAPLEKAVLKDWAKGRQVKSGLARIRGRMKFQGSARAKPGKLIELEGVGNRFKGKVYVCAVRHEIRNGDWFTEAEFGLAPEWFAEKRDLVAPPASGFTPGIEGLQIGVVKKLDADPEGQHKIQVSVPVLQAETDGVWARLSKFYGSDDFGAFFVPEIGDEVVLGYFNNDPSHPVVLGSMYSSKRKPPYSLTKDNFIKAVITRSKLKLEFDDEKKIITVITPAKNEIVVSDDGKSILLKDQTGNKIELNPDGILLDSPKDIKINAKGKIAIDAVGEISVSSKADVKVTGLNINNTAQVGFVGKGSATAELSASGQTTVKGAMVMIN